MTVLERDGTQIHYETHGEGPAILLTHGFSATLDMWRGQIDELTRDHTLILWDMRGHGQTRAAHDDSAYGETQTTADMAALLDHLGIEHAIIGGLSLGGYMSLAFYADYPERTRALLIFDTGPGFRKDEARDAWNARAMERAEIIEREGAASLSGGTAERINARHADYRSLAFAARHMLAQKDGRIMELLPAISVPALVLVGADDTPFLGASDYMAKKIPGAAKAVIPKAGHAANIDQPEAFNAAVREFLDKNGL